MRQVFYPCTSKDKNAPVVFSFHSPALWSIQSNCRPFCAIRQVCFGSSKSRNLQRRLLSTQTMKTNNHRRHSHHSPPYRRTTTVVVRRPRTTSTTQGMTATTADKHTSDGPPPTTSSLTTQNPPTDSDGPLFVEHHEHLSNDETLVSVRQESLSSSPFVLLYPTNTFTQPPRSKRRRKLTLVGRLLQTVACFMPLFLFSSIMYIVFVLAPPPRPISIRHVRRPWLDFTGRRATSLPEGQPKILLSVSTDDRRGGMAAVPATRSGSVRLPEHELEEVPLEPDHGGDVSPDFRFETQSWEAPICEPLPNLESISYTLVTQSSESRVWMMEQHCQRWKHDVAIAIAVNFDDKQHQGDLQDAIMKKEHFYRHTLQSLGCDSSKLAVVVVPYGTAADQNNNSTQADGQRKEYPVNRLRNQALSLVRTTHVVYLDIDFWPSFDLYHILDQPSIRQHLLGGSSFKQASTGGDQAALVIPAFQIRRQCRQYKDCREQNIQGMPRNRKELISRIRRREAFQFDPTNRGGHGSTLYRPWMTQPASQLKEISCFQSHRYEPYLVFRYCRNLPPFQEAFTGYGKNKMTWVMHLRRLGWRFWQLGGDAFVVHYPHLESPTRLTWNGGAHGEMLHRPDQDDDSTNFDAYARGRVDAIYLEFLKWLYRTVPDTSVVPQCHAVQKDGDGNKEEESEDDDLYKLWVPRRVIEEFKKEFPEET